MLKYQIDFNVRNKQRQITYKLFKMVLKYVVKENE